MARIDLVDVAHCYRPGAGFALRPMTMTWNDGGAYALLGPSGCGKTTLLNIISGLIRPLQGRVLLGGRDVTDLPPQARNIAQVFQFPVIYDTMTVFENLAFPLRNRRWQAADTDRRVREVAQMLELAGDLGRRARGLPTHVEQKIALGRGLVRPDVAAVLLDEPLTAVDPHVKWLLRRKLKQIHAQLALSLIYVTHDQTEALTFADKVVVMTEGEVVQTGTAQELFETPAHTFVGHFVGNPGMNLLSCSIEDDVARLGQARVALPGHARQAFAGLSGPFKLGIRPEFVECSPSPIEGGHPVELLSVRPMGNHTLVSARLEDQSLWAKVRDTPGLAVGRAWVRLPRERVQVYANERRVDLAP
jgi:glycerol transport system ATP-binding protein